MESMRNMFLFSLFVKSHDDDSTRAAALQQSCETESCENESCETSCETCGTKSCGTKSSGARTKSPSWESVDVSKCRCLNSAISSRSLNLGTVPSVCSLREFVGRWIRVVAVAQRWVAVARISQFFSRREISNIFRVSKKRLTFEVFREIVGNVPRLRGFQTCWKISQNCEDFPRIFGNFQCQILAAFL